MEGLNFDESASDDEPRRIENLPDLNPRIHAGTILGMENRKDVNNNLTVGPASTKDHSYATRPELQLMVHLKAIQNLRDSLGPDSDIAEFKVEREGLYLKVAMILESVDKSLLEESLNRVNLRFLIELNSPRITKALKSHNLYRKL